MKSIQTTALAGVFATLMAVATQAPAAELAKVKTADAREPIVIAAQPGQPTIVIRKLVVRPTNERIGTIQSGWFCGTSAEARFGPNLSKLFTADVLKVAAAELVAAGYPRPASAQESVFATAQAPVASDYDIGVLVKDVRIEVCERDKLVEGGVWLQMNWELFLPRQQKTVFSLATEGSAQTGANEKLPFVALLQRAVRASVRNLLADNGFSELARRPVDAAAPAGAASAAAAGSVAAPLRITASTGSDTGTQERMPQLQSAVATLRNGAGSGSGFYIHGDGYLLTNQHVVGDARYIQVKLANGRTLVGEVLRSDRQRDVALVKTEAVALTAIPIRADDAPAGEDVFAIGSPLGETFATTVTRGVLSGSRTIGQQRWLQSDVKILPGSSGGPLIGSHGAAIGMTSRGIASGTAGINLFVPIREALQTLGIELATE